MSATDKTQSRRTWSSAIPKGHMSLLYVREMESSISGDGALQKVEKMPLPKVRKTSASKADNLAQLVAASSIAELDLARRQISPCVALRFAMGLQRTMCGARSRRLEVRRAGRALLRPHLGECRVRHARGNFRQAAKASCVPSSISSNFYHRRIWGMVALRFSSTLRPCRSDIRCSR